MTMIVPAPSLLAMAEAMELDVLGKRENLRICLERAGRGRWPMADVDRKRAYLPLFEAIARDLRARAEADLQTTHLEQQR